MFLRPTVFFPYDQWGFRAAVLVAGVDSIGLDASHSSVGARSRRFDNFEY